MAETFLAGMARTARRSSATTVGRSRMISSRSLGNLPGQRQPRIGVFAQLLAQPPDVLFPRRRLLTPLDLAQVGRLDADPVRQLAQRERRIALRFRQAALPQEFSE